MEPEQTFRIPVTYELEEELRPDPPREVPPGLRYSQADRMSQSGALVTAFIGLLLILLSPTEWMANAADFILPLEFALWIGLGLLLLGLFLFLKLRYRKNSSQYIQEGVAIPGVVKQLIRQPIDQNLNQQQSQTSVKVEVKDPRTGSLTVYSVPSSINYPSIRVGDTVTTLHLPGEFPHSLRIYRFMGFRRESMAEKRSIWDIPCVTALTLIAFFGMLIFILVSMQLWKMTDDTGVLVLSLVGSCLIGIPMAALTWVLAKQHKKRQEWLKQAWKDSGGVIEVTPAKVPGKAATIFIYSILFLGFLLLGAGVCYSIGNCLNAVLDNSPARKVPIRIIAMEEETHKFIIRTYKLRYHYLKDATKQSHDFPTTSRHMRKFRVWQDAHAVLRDGFFGWEWIETIEK